MKIWLSLLLTCWLVSVQAQSGYDTFDTVNKKAKKCYKQGLLLSQKGEYAEATKHFDKTLKKYPNFIDAHLQKASIHFEKKDYTEAIRGFNKVLALDPDYNFKVYYTLGMSCYKSGDYVCAEQNMTTYINANPKSNRLKIRAEQILQSASAAIQLSDTTYDVKLKPLPSGINTENSEYLPCFSLDGNTLIFTRKIGADEDFYSSKRINNEWSEAKPMTFINTNENEGAQTLSADGQLLIYTGCNRRDGIGSCDLYYTYKRDGQWVKPKNMGENINTPGWESQPSLSVDGQSLYFASNRGGGLGGNDIWVSHKSPEGYYGEAVNLGDKINTSKNEFAPFIHADDHTLYFTSDGHIGFGKTDIFKSERSLQGQWQDPLNLGAPVNTYEAEGALVISTKGDTAYFARTQVDADGGEMDIYSFVLPEKFRPTEVTYVEAVIRDRDTKLSISGATLILIDNNTGEEMVRQKSKSDGTFLMALPVGKDYAFKIEQDNYLFYSDRFKLDDIHQKSEPFIYEILLNPAEVTADSPSPSVIDPIILKNVFFETGKYDLLPSSIPELESLNDQLIKYADLKIQINGHTDNVGDDQSNLILSEKRAQSVYQFLLNKGIDKSRLSFKGYGENRSILDNDTDEGRSKNRRTEFIIIK